MCEVKHKVVPGPVTSGGVRVNECVRECVSMCCWVCACMRVYGGALCTRAHVHTPVYLCVCGPDMCARAHMCACVCVIHKLPSHPTPLTFSINHYSSRALIDWFIWSNH